MNAQNFSAKSSYGKFSRFLSINLIGILLLSITGIGTAFAGPLPNTLPVASFTVQPAQNVHEMPMTVSVSDNDANTVQLTIEYSLNGTDWNPANHLSNVVTGAYNVGSNVITGIATNGESGTSAAFDWDFTLDGVTSSHEGVLMRVTPNDGTDDGTTVSSNPADITFHFPTNGDGSSGSPYQITTCAQLGDIGLNETFASPSAHYIVENDLGTTGSPCTTMIATTFTGTFNGNGHRITESISVGDDIVGLFSHLQGATISDLWITGSVSGNKYVGGLAGTATNNSSTPTTISRVKSSVSVTAGDIDSGGIVGVVEAPTISPDPYTSGVTIQDSEFVGTISSSSANVGGIVGNNLGGMIEDSYSSGSIHGAINLGGIAGYTSDYLGTDAPFIHNTFNVGTITAGLWNGGGIIGQASLASLTQDLVNNYADMTLGGNVNCVGTDGSGGYNHTGVCENVTGADLKNSKTQPPLDQWGFYEDDNVNNFWHKNHSGYPSLEEFTPTITNISPSQGPMAGGTSVTITGTNFDDAATVNFDGQAATDVTVNSGTQMTVTTPAHAPAGVDVEVVDSDGSSAKTVEGYIYPSDFHSGDGTSGNPYEIATCQQLQKIKNHLSDPLDHSYYILVGEGDLDCSMTNPSNDNFDSGTWDSNGFLPIGNQSAGFGGHFDGQNHAITGLYINQESNDTGLFGRVDLGGEIKNVGVTNATVHNNAESTGILVGYNLGTVLHSYSSGTVNGDDEVGGLVGSNDGQDTVYNSYSTANATGNHGVGGLVGGNYGTIHDTFAMGNVTIQNNGTGAGGLAGTNDGTIKNSYYSTGTVTGTSGTANIGGLVGYNSSSITNSYSAGTIDSNIIGVNTDVGGFIGYTSASLTNVDWLNPQTSLNAIGADAFSSAGDPVALLSHAAMLVYGNDTTDVTAFYSPFHTVYNMTQEGGYDFATPVWNSHDSEFPTLVGLPDPYSAILNVTSISPNVGSTLGGETVVITGTGFQMGTTFTFGGQPATVVDGSDTSFTVKTPAHAAGAVDVVATNPDTSHKTVANGFTYGTFAVSFANPTPANSASLDHGASATVALTSGVGNHYAFTDFDHDLKLRLGMDQLVGEGNPLDSSSYARNIVTTGAHQVDDGKFGKSFTFNGEGDELSFTRPVQDDFTVCAWIKTGGVGGSFSHWDSAPIFESEVPNWAKDFGFGLNFHGDIMFGAGGMGNNADNTVNGGIAVNDNQWHDVCATRQSSNGLVNLYVDGSPDASGHSGTGPLDDKATSQVGVGADGPGKFNGNIDELLVFGRVLSAGEISSLYDGHANQYSHEFTSLDDGSHSFTGYAVNTAGTVVQTSTRTITVQAAPQQNTNTGGVVVLSALTGGNSTGSNSNSGQSSTSSGTSGTSASTSNTGVCPAVNLASADEPFTDAVGHWAHDCIIALYKANIVTGRGPHLYVPDGTLTRAEAVKIGLLAFGYSLDVNTPSGFTDLNANAWYVQYLRKAKALGVIGGTKFYPDAPITRADALVLYLKLAKKFDATAPAAPFTDVVQTADYAPYVNYAYEKGVVKGRTATLFVPDGTITRGEIAKIVMLIKAL